MSSFNSYDNWKAGPSLIDNTEEPEKKATADDGPLEACLGCPLGLEKCDFDPKEVKCSVLS